MKNKKTNETQNKQSSSNETKNVKNNSSSKRPSGSKNCG